MSASSYGQPPAGELAAGVDDAVVRRLVAQPCRELAKPLTQPEGRTVAEHAPRQRDVGEAVADVADAVFPGDRRGRRLAQGCRDEAGDVEDAVGFAAADV